jgi:hypothetical protein
LLAEGQPAARGFACGACGIMTPLTSFVCPTTIIVGRAKPPVLPPAVVVLVWGWGWLCAPERA